MPLANNTLSDLSGLKSVFIGQYCVWPAVQKNNDEEYIHKCQLHWRAVVGVRATWGRDQRSW